MACIKKRGNRYVLDFYDQKGVRQRITLPEETTKKAAKEKLREMEELVARGVFLPVKKTPLFSEVAKEWIEYKKPQLRETTWESYEAYIRNHFEEFADVRIDRITIAAIEGYIRTRQMEGMKIATIRRILVSLGQIFKYAVRHRYIVYSPFADAEKARDAKRQKKAIVILNPEKIQALLNNTTDREYRTLFMLAVMSGTREGELFGLKWSDVDWEDNQIHIQRTHNKGRFFPTKTETSNRRVDLGGMVMTELKKWKLACPRSGLDLVFPNSEGNPLTRNNMMERHFLPALKKAGLPRMRFHDLRHSYASLLIAQGENIKYIQMQLGHSSPTVTLNVYAHLMDHKNPKAASRLEATVFSTGHKVGTNDGELVMESL